MGRWHSVTKARLTVDGTGDQRHRLDFAGGAGGSQFFLHNCGFFTATAKAGDSFDVQTSRNHPPGRSVADGSLRFQQQVHTALLRIPPVSSGRTSTRMPGQGSSVGLANQLLQTNCLRM